MPRKEKRKPEEEVKIVRKYLVGEVSKSIALCQQAGFSQEQ